MPHFTARQLADLLRGQLELADLPPLDGPSSVVGEIRTDVDRLRDGDVFWAVDGMKNSGRDRVEEAFARGASGVVASNYDGPPWAGRWTIHVDDAGAAFFQSAIAASSMGLHWGENQEQSPSHDVRTCDAEPVFCRKLDDSGVAVLDWSESASVDRWRDALKELRAFNTSGRRWVAVGDLCGPRWDTGAMHRQVGADAVAIGDATGVLGCGQFATEIAGGACNAGANAENAVACGSIPIAIATVHAKTRRGDVLLVAGSRHLNMRLLIDAMSRKKAAA